MNQLRWEDTRCCAESTAGLYQILTLGRLSPEPTYKPQFTARYTLKMDRACPCFPTLEQARAACERHHTTGEWAAEHLVAILE